MNFIADLGFAVRNYVAGLGLGARLFIRLVSLFASNMRRFGLVRDQVHFLGNYSLAIIAVSGLFVGFVLSLQGYYTLQRYGSAEAVGLLFDLDTGPETAGQARFQILARHGHRIDILACMGQEILQQSRYGTEGQTKFMLKQSLRGQMDLDKAEVEDTAHSA